MQHFITGLQFLTRIRLVNQTEWSPESFGRSVKYFPIVGSVLGLILAATSHIMAGYLPAFGAYVPPHVMAAILVIAPIVLTGGLHCDGFMDTMDGIFSGRSRERMLEIMKDSRVGANGVVAFCLLLLLKWSLFLDISPSVLPTALFLMPILGRLAMVIGITVFPYARPDGIGKAFAQFADKRTLLIAMSLTLLFVVPLGGKAIFSSILVSCFAIIIGCYVTKLLGGLTGDVYGAITELTEALVLIIFIF